MTEKIAYSKPREIVFEGPQVSRLRRYKDRSCKVAQLARMLKLNGVDADRAGLFRWMVDNGHLYRDGGGRYHATKTARAAGWLFTEEYDCVKNGRRIHVCVPRVTRTGQHHYIELFALRGERIGGGDGED